MKILELFADTWSIGNPYPIKEQVAKIGNSVVPIMAMKIAKANIQNL